MKYVELYTDKVLEAASLGHSVAEFDELMGDYVKVEVFLPKGDGSFHSEVGMTVYSNRLLMKYENGDLYYGDYHYHKDNGFMIGKEHTDESHDIIYPIPEDVDSNVQEPLTNTSEYKKQLILYSDVNDNIYIKPNEFMRNYDFAQNKYKLRVWFLRDFRSEMAQNLSILNGNYIENGNFYAGLEATQTGDLDHSVGHNKFVRMENPGLGNYCLEQNGHGENHYNMQITGIESNCSYIFSCWVAWDDNFDAGHSITEFDTDGILMAVDDIDNSDCGGTKLKNGTRDMDSVEINGLKWHRRFLKFFVSETPTFSQEIIMKIGYNTDRNAKFRQSNKLVGRRYFADLRLEKSMDGVDVNDQVKKYMGPGYPVAQTPDNNDTYMHGSGSHDH